MSNLYSYLRVYDNLKQMTAEEYQIYLTPLISKKLNLEVKNEWRAFQGYPLLYSPRVDIAIGPFNVSPNENQTQYYNQILKNDVIDKFLKSIYAYHISNIEQEWMEELSIPTFQRIMKKNQNARCFLAFEIENTSSKKHIMGSLINASSLGRAGIGIAYNNSVKRTFIRILNYLAFLKRVGKNTYDTTNFLILTKEQLQTLIE